MEKPALWSSNRFWPTPSSSSKELNAALPLPYHQNSAIWCTSLQFVYQYFYRQSAGGIAKQHFCQLAGL